MRRWQSAADSASCPVRSELIGWPKTLLWFAGCGHLDRPESVAGVTPWPGPSVRFPERPQGTTRRSADAVVVTTCRGQRSGEAGDERRPFCCQVPMATWAGRRPHKLDALSIPLSICSSTLDGTRRTGTIKPPELDNSTSSHSRDEPDRSLRGGDTGRIPDQGTARTEAIQGTPISHDRAAAVPLSSRWPSMFLGCPLRRTAWTTLE